MTRAELERFEAFVDGARSAQAAVDALGAGRKPGLLQRRVATLPGIPPSLAHKLGAVGGQTVADLITLTDPLTRMRFRNIGAKSTAALLAAVLAAIAEEGEP